MKHSYSEWEKTSQRSIGSLEYISYFWFQQSLLSRLTVTTNQYLSTLQISQWASTGLENLKLKCAEYQLKIKFPADSWDQASLHFRHAPAAAFGRAGRHHQAWLFSFLRHGFFKESFESEILLPKSPECWVDCRHIIVILIPSLRLFL